jgi:hypothetical protein
MVSGWVFPQGDFARYWAGSPALGLALSYPFHPRLPVFLSGLFSLHRPAPTSAAQGASGSTKRDIVLINAKLCAEYSLLEDRTVSPTLRFGLNTDTFVFCHVLSPGGGAVLTETEVGPSLGAGIVATLGKRLILRLYLDQNVVLTEPRVVWYAAAAVHVGVVWGVRRSERP